MTDKIKYFFIANKDRLNIICWLIFLFLLATGCSTIKYVPTETKVEVIQKDSLVIRDSIIFIPKERVVDIVPQYDTLKLVIEAAESKSWIDTSFHCLRGEIQAKKWQEKEIIYKDKIIQKDTTIYKEIPYPVEVEKKYIPKWCWYSLITNIILLFSGIAAVYFKLKLGRKN